MPFMSGSAQGCSGCTGSSAGRTLEVSGKCPGHRHEGSAQAMNDIHQSMAHQGLVRPREGRVLGGVCAGLGRRFGIDPWPARIIFVLLLMLIPGSQILVYPILWILMPSEEAVDVEAYTPPSPVT